jgi:hypothetical protein
LVQLQVFEQPNSIGVKLAYKWQLYHSRLLPCSPAVVRPLREWQHIWQVWLLHQWQGRRHLHRILQQYVQSVWHRQRGRPYLRGIAWPHA